MFTSSFAWTSPPASVARTSFAFMFELVPEPVWKTSIGNWSSSSPEATRSAAEAIRSALSASSRPSSAFTRAAAPLIRPSQRATEAGIGSPETVKLATALRVSSPQSSVRVSPSATNQSVVRPCPGAWHRGVYGLDDAEAAPLERALADHPPSELGEVIDAGPADVTAARALAGIEMANFAGRVPPGSAGKALDPD